MMPRGISRVYAMARPRRPGAEKLAVRAAADGPGSAKARAQRLARAVAVRTLEEMDRQPHEQVITLLATLDPSPVAVLATDADIDTAALIRAERARRAEARGGRRLPEAEWPAEDRDVLESVRATLAERYRRHLER